MTAAEAFSGDSPRARFLTWTAHLLVPVTAVTFVLSVISDIAPDWMPWLGALASTAGNAVFGVAILHYLFAGLCVRCMQEVPEDAARQAVRRRWLLWVWHRLPAFAVAYMVLMVAAFVAKMTLGMFWLFLLPDTLVLALAGAVWAHHRLRPWCPYCRDWDQDGAHEPSPVPPAGVKQS